jgi:Flp pilus assembly protein TadD
VLVAALALLAHARSLSGEFLTWDDDHYVTNNLDVRHPTLDGVVQIFGPSSLVLREWTPVVTLSFAVEHALFELDPRPYHVTNWLLHAATSALVVLLLAQIGAPILLAAGAGALFAVHPLQVESVAWVSARKNLLALLFSLASLLVYVRGRGTRTVLASLGLFVLALGSKGTAVVVPLWLLAYRLTVGREGASRKEGLRVVALLAPFFVLALARGLWSIHTQAEVVERTAAMGLADRLAAMGPVSITYLCQLFWPMNLSAHYAWPPLDWGDPRVIGSWAFVLALAGAVALWGRRDRRVAFAGLLAVAGLFPTSNLIAAPFLQADRYTHMALVGVAYLVVAGAWSSSRKVRLPPVAAGVAVAAWLAIVLVPTTWARTAVWKSSCSLWRDTVAHAPTHSPALSNLGLCLLGEGNFEGAELEFRKALALDSSNAEAWNNLGTLLLGQKRPEEARDAFHQAIALDPRRSTPHRNVAKAYHELGELGRAEFHLRRAIELAPRRPAAYSALGFLLADQGRTGEAERWLREGLAMRETPDTHNNLAWLLLETGRTKEGLLHARQAVRLRPKFAAAWDTLGVALARAGQPDEAREAFERALTLNPDLQAPRDHLEKELEPL